MKASPDEFNMVLLLGKGSVTGKNEITQMNVY